MHNTLFLWNDNIGDRMLYYLNCFYLYSFLGFLIELFLKTFLFHGMNSGVLYGPWLPVYGFGAIFVIFMMRLIFNRIKAPRWVKILLLFISVSIFLSLIEYLGGVLIEAFFHKTFWDYSNMKFSMGPYVSFEMALVWGSASLLLIYVIKPLLDPLVKKIPVVFSLLLSVLFLIDVFCTFVIKL